MSPRVAEDIFVSDRPQPSAGGDELRRLAAVGLMTPSIAHDVNNALHAVQGILQMIQRRVPNGASDELASLATDGLQGIQRAVQISRRLMDFTRISARRRTRVEVNGLLRNLEPLLGWVLGPGIGLGLSLGEAVLETWCDPHDLENAVMNLAVNARHAMPGGGEFTLRTLRVDLPLNLPGLLSGDYVVIAAADTGEGMTADVLSRAFDPFFTTKAHGHGFGLASVRAFVEAAGGLADITSRPSEGSTVRLYLPLARPSPLNGAPSA
jgi:signal transduction histidine kinase